MTTVPPDRETLEARDAEARRRIEHDLDVSLVVEAAAGAGKTTLLVGRLIALLAAGKATVDGIAAVTFTRKAAGELKLRLRQALDGARSAEADAVRRARLEDALAHLETARIGTIHGLCAELLRARPVEAGIDPHFREIDQDAARAHYDRLFDRWLQARLDDPPAGLRRALARLAARGGRAGGPGGNHDDPLAQLRHAGWELAEWRDFPAPWTAPAEDASRAAQIERLIDDVRALADLHDRCPDRHDALKQAFAPAALTAAWFAISARAGGAPDLDVAEGQLLALANDLRGHRFKRGRGRWFVPAVAAAARSGDAARDDGVTRDDAIAQRDALMEAIQAFRDDADAALAAALREDLRATVEAYDASKRRLGDLDFLDLLLCARDLLRDRDDVRRAFQQQIRHVFVDEFQDTDPLQAEILLLLAADDPAERDWRRVRPAPGKLFLVGDPKQSIYRFRRADLGLYRRVCAQLAAAGVPQLHLHRSFRALEPLQGTINAAFAPEMIADDDVQQPDYAAMLPHRRVPDDVAQPAIVALPAPYPYGYRDVTKTAIEGCLPDAVAAWIAWLLHESGWTVADPARGGARVPVRPRHVAVLFRRFVSWGDDVTRGYVRGLEARAVPYVLIGGRGFHQRAEVMTLRAALRAIESPDDALAVYAALRGDLFALGDDQLLAYSLAYGRPHPLRVPRALVDDHAARAHFAPVLDALAALARLHRRRNRVPAATVIDDLLAAVRAHAGFVLRPAGRQVLANVERVAELARRAERAEGASFGRFVASLEAAADRIGAGGDAPAMDALADGVRVMTVHSAKGLEFPIVVLADPTAKLAAARPGRAIDPEAGRAAVRLMGCAPEDLRRAEAIEQQRDRAEGVRLAYVAATRARDVLVVPVVGDGPALDDGWLQPLDNALYPPPERARDAHPAPGCPSFRGTASVLQRPMRFDGRDETSVRPGLHRPQTGAVPVAWWDPSLLVAQGDESDGQRAARQARDPQRERLLVPDGDDGRDGPVAQATADAHAAWQSAEARARRMGAQPSQRVATVTERARALRPPGADDDAAWVEETLVPRIEIDVPPRADERPSGVRFGTLVHTVLRDVPLAGDGDADEDDGDPGTIAALASLHGRLLACPAAEIDAAATAVRAALAHPLLQRARRAAICHRELPVLVRDADGAQIEGTIDLAFRDAVDGPWTVVDFKTDRALDAETAAAYRLQVAWYLVALRRVDDETGRPGEEDRGVLLGV